MTWEILSLQSATLLTILTHSAIILMKFCFLLYLQVCSICQIILHWQHMFRRNVFHWDAIHHNVWDHKSKHIYTGNLVGLQKYRSPITQMSDQCRQVTNERELGHNKCITISIRCFLWSLNPTAQRLAATNISCVRPKGFVPSNGVICHTSSTHDVRVMIRISNCL